MSFEWFHRMENAVRQSLPDVCESIENYDIVFETDITTKHPLFIFAIDEDEFGDDDFCLIHYDPVNQEFYSHHYDEEADLQVKVLFENLDDMLQFIHAAFHEYLEDADVECVCDEEDDDEEYDEFDDEYDDEDEFDDEYDDEDETAEEQEIEWLPGDKYIHIEENNPKHETQLTIHYRIGKVIETGDGVLMRSTVTREDDDEEEEGIMLFFKEEEAPYIADLIGEYLSHTEQEYKRR